MQLYVPVADGKRKTRTFLQMKNVPGTAIMIPLNARDIAE